MFLRLSRHTNACDTGRSTEPRPLQKLHGQKVCLSFGVSKRNWKSNKGPFLDAHGLYSGPQGFEERITKILQNNFVTTYHLGPAGMGICLELRWILPWIWYEPAWDIVSCPMKPNQHHVNWFIVQQHLAISFHIIHYHNDSQCMFQIVSTCSALIQYSFQSFKVIWCSVCWYHAKSLTHAMPTHTILLTIWPDQFPNLRHICTYRCSDVNR